ncbi:hydantoinase B/oxoprolinase family protein [Lysinibacillus sp. NPDC056232]|uniref:hydantoinase B/oxoprolinase family protein n=1 Tax=Lysinibacillus sp. NPDC056232 TaxID=3345756 RepID=UPI0035DF76D9
MSTTKLETNQKVQNLDPVTFEVLKNGFVNLVDQMAEQMLRTCYSFVIYNRDFSCALCDAQGNTRYAGNTRYFRTCRDFAFNGKSCLRGFR